MNFLTDGLTIKLTKYEEEILGVDLPDKVEMIVTEAEPAVKGDTTSSALKKGKTNTGLEIMLPLFVDEGTKILVSTNDGKYAGRVQN
jgi:elongation factor P